MLESVHSVRSASSVRIHTENTIKRSARHIHPESGAIELRSQPNHILLVLHSYLQISQVEVNVLKSRGPITLFLFVHNNNNNIRSYIIIYKYQNGFINKRLFISSTQHVLPTPNGHCILKLVFLFVSNSILPTIHLQVIINFQNNLQCIIDVKNKTLFNFYYYDNSAYFLFLIYNILQYDVPNFKY